VGFPLIPNWYQETIPLPYEPIEGQQITLGCGYLQALGVRTQTELSAGVSITYSDEHGTGANDTATMTVNGVNNSVDEIAVYFTDADSGMGNAHPDYRIAPLQMSLSGTTLTITGHRALFVSPTVWDNPYTAQDEKNQADHTQASDFVSTVDVYAITADDTNALMVNGCADSPTAITAKIVDSRQGVIELTSSGACTGYGQTLDVFYKAGHPMESFNMATIWAKALTYLANTLMPESSKQLCNPSRTAYEQQRRPATVSDQSTAFGSLQGQVLAYQIVENHRLACQKSDRAKRVKKQVGTV
jgi:hypothetical protein